MPVKTTKKQKGLTDKQLIEKYGNLGKAKEFDGLIKSMITMQAKGALLRKPKTGKK